jgi:hypothetical protein
MAPTWVCRLPTLHGTCEEVGEDQHPGGVGPLVHLTPRSTALDRQRSGTGSRTAQARGLHGAAHLLGAQDGSRASTPRPLLLRSVRGLRRHSAGRVGGALRPAVAEEPSYRGRRIGADDRSRAVKCANARPSGRSDSNRRPPAPKAGALTRLRYAPPPDSRPAQTSNSPRPTSRTAPPTHATQASSSRATSTWSRLGRPTSSPWRMSIRPGIPAIPSSDR